MVVVNILLIYELDVLRGFINKIYFYNLGTLNDICLILDGQVLGCYMLLKEFLPLGIGQSKAIEPVNLLAKVGYHLRLAGDVHILIALFRKLFDEGQLQFLF